MTLTSPAPRRRSALASLTRTAGLAALAAFGPLTACTLQTPFEAARPAQSTAANSSRNSEQPVDTGATAADTFKQFNDIPIPADADIDLEQSLVLGTEDGWIGRLSLDVNYVMIDMYAFYTKEMPRFGWEQLTTVRARISTMTYRRGARVAGRDHHHAAAFRSAEVQQPEQRHHHRLHGGAGQPLGHRRRQEAGRRLTAA